MDTICICVYSIDIYINIDMKLKTKTKFIINYYHMKNVPITILSDEECQLEFEKNRRRTIELRLMKLAQTSNSKISKLKKVVVGLVTFLVALWFWGQESVEASGLTDTRIKKYCHTHPLSKDVVHTNHLLANRCTAILQMQVRIETKRCAVWTWHRYNNCFWFRGWYKKSWNRDYWLIRIRNWFLVFNSKNNSIRFAVDRFYRIDRYKKLKTIVYGWSYYHYRDQRYYRAAPFTQTDQRTYLEYLKTHYWKFYHKK